MKKNILQTTGILTEMEKLLTDCSEPAWAEALRRGKEQLSYADGTGAGKAARELLRLFSGAGSLSDLVLYRQGQARPDINDRFAGLRTDLSRALLELVSSADESK